MDPHQEGGAKQADGFFVEIPEAWPPRGKHTARRSWASARGAIRGVAWYEEDAPLTIDGSSMIGFPIHWGYAGAPNHTGPLANTLTPSAQDPNTWTPEYKAFLVRLKKA